MLCGLGWQWVEQVSVVQVGNGSFVDLSLLHLHHCAVGLIRHTHHITYPICIQHLLQTPPWGLPSTHPLHSDPIHSCYHPKTNHHALIHPHILLGPINHILQPRGLTHISNIKPTPILLIIVDNFHVLFVHVCTINFYLIFLAVTNCEEALITDVDFFVLGQVDQTLLGELVGYLGLDVMGVGVLEGDIEGGEEGRLGFGGEFQVGEVNGHVEQLCPPTAHCPKIPHKQQIPILVHQILVPWVDGGPNHFLLPIIEDNIGLSLHLPTKMIYKGVIVDYKLTHPTSQSTLPQLLELFHHTSRKIIYIKLMSVILLTLLQLGASVAINHALLPLNESSYSYEVKKKVNVTIGEEFGLVMPGMDPMIANFTVYRLSQETFLNWFETQQTHQASPQKALAPNKTFSCQAHPASISIKQILTKMHKPSSFSYAGTPKHTIVRTYNLLYLLDPELNDLTAYYYNEQSMKAQASHRLPLPSNRKSNRIAMASSSNQSHLYVMTSVGIWTVETKTILARVNRVDSLGGFNSRERKIDDLLHGWNGWLVGINKLRAVYIIPENPSQKFQQIREYKNEYLAPQDIYIQGKYLYILDLHKGIYIYKQFVNGSILEYDFIEHESYGNMKLMVKDESIFVNYNDEYGNKIIQINYSRGRGAELVRYYKDEEFITSMSVSRVRVSSPDPQGGNSKEDLLFLMADNGDLLAYPYNVDPRTLHTLHNGIKTLVEGGNSLHFISGDRYLVITSTGFLYARLQIKRPELLCRKNAHDHHMFYQISFESNVSSCQHFSQSAQPEKLFYNTNCRLTTTYTINVNDPYKSWVEKLYLYAVVILTIGAFIVGLMFMVEWRRNKLFVLGKIKDQIQKFREKHRKMQPFTEDIQKQQDIEFQLPEPPIDHDL